MPRRLVIELADGTTTPLEPAATQAHDETPMVQGTTNPVASNVLPTPKSKGSHFPEARPIDPATHWPILSFCASNRSMIMDKPKQEAQRIIQLLMEFCDVQLGKTDWTLDEAFSLKGEDGSEIVVPRVTIISPVCI